MGCVLNLMATFLPLVSFQHVKPGKGPAFVRTKLKNVKTGKVIDNTFTSGVKVTYCQRLKDAHTNFLYKDDFGFQLYAY